MQMDCKWIRIIAKSTISEVGDLEAVYWAVSFSERQITLILVPFSKVSCSICVA